MLLTRTQKEFVKHFENEIANHNHIIVYNHKGHFGLDTALSHKYPNIEMMDLDTLRKKKDNSLIYKILNTFFSFLAIMKISKKVDETSTINTSVMRKNSLDSWLNKYYCIDDDYSYLRYLKIKKDKSAKKKIKYIVRCDHELAYNQNDINDLKYIFSLIEDDRICNTAMLFSYQNYKKVSELLCHNTFPTFELDNNDIECICTQKGLQIDEGMLMKEKLISITGIEFFIKNNDFFNEITLVSPKTDDNFFELMDDLYKYLLHSFNLDFKINEFTQILEFSSFFTNVFSNLALKKFENGKFDINNLDPLCKIAMLNALTKEDARQDYNFSMEAFRSHFYKRYAQELFVEPKVVFEYFVKNQPFDYRAIMKILRIDSSIIDYQEMQSYIMIGYFFSVENFIDLDINHFKIYTNSNSLVNIVLSIHEKFKNKDYTTDYADKYNLAIKKIREENDLNAIGSCSALCLLLQILKEDFFYLIDQSFHELLCLLSNEIENIDKVSLYGEYWMLYFREQFIALSLEDDLCKMPILQRQYNCVNDSIDDEMTSFISDHGLRSFDRLDLLSHSMDFPDAEERLNNLFEKQNKESLFKEIVRINYSACLIEHAKYSEAYALLNVISSQEYLKAINLDSYHAYLNNLAIAKYLSSRIGIDGLSQELHKLFLEEYNNNDDLIIKNNYYTACLISQDNKLSIMGYEKLKMIQESENKYNSFYALHNLLIYCFQHDLRKEYEDMLAFLDVPVLLKNDSTFFIEKFDKLNKNWNNKTIVYEKGVTRFEHYNSLYLFGVVERWFE